MDAAQLSTQQISVFEQRSGRLALIEAQADLFRHSHLTHRSSGYLDPAYHSKRQRHATQESATQQCELRQIQVILYCASAETPGISNGSKMRHHVSTQLRRYSAQIVPATEQP